MEAEKKEDGEAGKAAFGTWVAVRRPLRVDSPFFAAGNVERELLAKQISLEITEEEKEHIVQSEEEQLWQLTCPISGCGIQLKGVGELESHYLSRHSATCSVCTRVFPTTRLLNLHVSETHDSFFQAKVARNYPMYECLVEGCAARFVSDSSRHQHLVDKHHFPRSFRFHAKKHASQKQRQRHKAHQASTTTPAQKQSKPRNQKAKGAPRQTASEPRESASTAATTSLVAEAQQSGAETRMDVDELVAGVSRLSTVSRGDEESPAVIGFGHRRGRAVMAFGQKARGSGRGRARRGRGSEAASGGVAAAAQPATL